MKKITLILLFSLFGLVCEAGGLDYPRSIPTALTLEYDHLGKDDETGNTKIVYSTLGQDVLVSEVHMSADSIVYLKRETRYTSQGVFKESSHLDSRADLSFKLVRKEKVLEGNVTLQGTSLNLQLPMDPSLTTLGLLPNFLGNKLKELKKTGSIVFYLVPPLVVAKAAKDGLPSSWARIKMVATKVKGEKFKLGKKRISAIRVKLTPFDSLMGSFLPKENQELIFLLPNKGPFYLLEGKVGGVTYRLKKVTAQ
ncbi:MAG: hypothetical protein QNL04_11960 [SAR324 cluster bacterium]|nr:hypothetical protein [SAR324 cluster bacterium]